MRLRVPALWTLTVLLGLSALLSIGTAGAAESPRSSPIAVTPDGSSVVNVNPDTNTLTIFNATTNPPSLRATVRTGREPNSVAIHPNGQVAYVANSFDGTVSVVSLVQNAVTQTFAVGV